MNIESNKVEKCLKQNNFNNSDGDNTTHIKKSLNRGRVFFYRYLYALLFLELYLL